MTGKVLEISEVRTFQRKDGTSGKVGNLLLGDSTGTVRVTLWDDRTEFLNQVEYGDTVDLVNAYARENAFTQKVKLQVGNRSIIKKSEKKVEYEEEFTPVEGIKADMETDIPYLSDQADFKDAVSTMIERRTGGLPIVNSDMYAIAPASA